MSSSTCGRNSTAERDSVACAFLVNSLLDRLSSEDEDDIIPSDEEDEHNAWNLFLDGVQDQGGRFKVTHRLTGSAARGARPGP